MKSFIEVHLKTPRFIFCEICDEESKEVSKYYAYTVVHNYNGRPFPIEHRALECCLSHGNVVDWREE